jgi:hypothetical protein
MKGLKKNDMKVGGGNFEVGMGKWEGGSGKGEVKYIN